MREDFKAFFKKVIEKVGNKRDLLRNRTGSGICLALLSVTAVTLMTGILYYPNEAVINDNSNIKRVFTNYNTAGEILGEQEIEIGQLDRVDFVGVNDNEAYIEIHRALSIPLECDGETKEVSSAYDETVGDVLARAGVTLEEYDSVQPSSDTLCSEVEKITVSRAFEVTILVDGDEIKLSTANQNVEELLARAGVVMSQDDYVSPPLNSMATPNMVIEVTRVRYMQRETIELIPYETVTVTDNLRPMWESQVTVTGEDGQRTNTSLEKYVNGVKVSETAVKSEITKEPVNEVVTTGTAMGVPYSGRDSESLTLSGGIPENYQYVLTGKACAYTAPAGSGTYSGRTLQVGTVAVDPNVIPFGSELYIVSSDGSYVYGYAVAADTGDLTAHGVLVDLFMGFDTQAYNNACSFGARQVNVYVLSEGTR